MALRSSWQHWVDEVRLPMRYWQEHLSRTRWPSQQAQLALALQAIQEAFERHPCTGRLGPEVLADWKGWAADHAKAFQRASSAVEGRNGSLSQMQHNHRGLPKRRYLYSQRRAMRLFESLLVDWATNPSTCLRRLGDAQTDMHP